MRWFSISCLLANERISEKHFPVCSFNSRLYPRDADSGVVAEVMFSDAKPGICMTLTPSQGSRPSFEKETLVLFDVNLPTLGPHPEIPLPSLRAGLQTARPLSPRVLPCIQISGSSSLLDPLQIAGFRPPTSPSLGETESSKSLRIGGLRRLKGFKLEPTRPVYTPSPRVGRSS